jgi:hypothetical protein
VCNSETEKVSAVAHPSPGGWALGAQVEWPDGAVSECGQLVRPWVRPPADGAEARRARVSAVDQGALAEEPGVNMIQQECCAGREPT